MSIAYALNLMFEGNYRHIPVVDLNENLVGILSIKNFLEYVTKGIISDLEKEQRVK